MRCSSRPSCIRVSRCCRSAGCSRPTCCSTPRRWRSSSPRCCGCGAWSPRCAGGSACRSASVPWGCSRPSRCCCSRWAWRWRCEPARPGCPAWSWPCRSRRSAPRCTWRCARAVRGTAPRPSPGSGRRAVLSAPRRDSRASLRTLGMARNIAGAVGFWQQHSPSCATRYGGTVVKRTWFILLALVASVGIASALAQQRSISGKVSSVTTTEPVAGATVSVIGSPVAAVTNERGEFSLSAPQGAVTLSVRSIGYRHRTVAVAADQASVNVGLEQDVFNLEAVVITGQATGVEQRNLANAVTTVNPEQLNRAPTQTLESALQGKVPGAVIQVTSGARGGGGQITLRGVTTINGGVDPLIVVDGLVIANDAIASNMNAITAAAAGGNASSQDNSVNRIADLNPNDIQDIQILKGASAAAIYGSQAANGVIVITTRRGRPGAARFSVTQRFGTFSLANTLGARIYSDTTDAFSVWAPKVPRDTATRTLIRGLCNLANGRCPFFDNEDALYGEHQLSVETDASVTGGNDQTTYYLSGLVKKDGGIAPNTGYQKQSLRANLDQLLGTRFKLGINLNAVHSLTNRGISNNDNTGTSTYLVYPSTPSFLDLRPVNGVYPTNPFAPSNPLQTFAELKNAEDVWRILGTTTASADADTTATQRLRFTVTRGLAFFSQRIDILSRADLQFEPQDGQPGTVVLGKGSDLRLNLVGSAVHTYTPTSNAFQATTSAGFQYEKRDLNATNIVGRTIALGLQNVSQAASITSNQAEQAVKNLGLYGQEELLAAIQRLLLTLGIRGDRSSVNGDHKKYFVYPKAAASYRLVQPMGGLDELKLRAAWGQTGNPPPCGTPVILDSA